VWRQLSQWGQRTPVDGPANCWPILLSIWVSDESVVFASRAVWGEGFGSLFFSFIFLSLSQFKSHSKSNQTIKTCDIEQQKHQPLSAPHLIYEWITVLFPSLVIKTGIIRKGIPLK
jgi:hypothetical protein